MRSEQIQLEFADRDPQEICKQKMPAFMNARGDQAGNHHEGVDQHQQCAKQERRDAAFETNSVFHAASDKKIKKFIETY
jgi:hypothetical protein